MKMTTYTDELYHHGIKGQRWGVRRYQNEDGSLTAEGKKRRISGYKVYEEALGNKREYFRKKTGKKNPSIMDAIRLQKDGIKYSDEKIFKKYGLEGINKLNNYRTLLKFGQAAVIGMNAYLIYDLYRK